MADDATAASWNPAGLINLERPEISFVGLWKTISSDVTSAATPSLAGESWDESNINFMSYTHPMPIGSTDVVLSVNYHQVYDLGLEFKNLPTSVRSQGAISAYSLAGGLSMPGRPEISMGASFNWYAPSLGNGYVRHLERSFQAGPNVIKRTETLADLRGYNFTFGVLWDAYERDEELLTLGFVCHTPFTADAKNEKHDNDGDLVAGPTSIDIVFPLSLGAGVNYRFSDDFSTAFDVQWTQWSKHTYTDAVSSPGDTLAFRLGCERLVINVGESVLACRSGIFYEPRPAWDDILPVYGGSLGLGWTLKERFSLDFAYQFRWGEAEDFTLGTANFDYGIKEHLFVCSLITYIEPR